MSAVRSPGRLGLARSTEARLALVVADANWYTTENLFGELDRPGVDTLLLHCCDYANALTAGRPPWRWRWGRGPDRQGPRHWRQSHVLPPGWMKRFPRLGMRPIRRAVDRWRLRLGSDAPLALVMTYPHYRYLRDLIRPDVQIYLNLDDYALYWPGQAEEVERLERQLVGEADLTACVARARAEQLRRAMPEAASKIHHLPHGTPGAFLSGGATGLAGPGPADLAGLPRPWLGYVGNLEERFDWALLRRVAGEFPGASVVLIGRPPEQGAGPWFDEARACLAMPNVHAVGFRAQEGLGAYIRSFDACLIPYRVDHPFNRSCCPTKIMDYMGSGRPIISTDLPECRLYDGLIDVARDDDDFVEAIGSLICSGFEDPRESARLELARENSCRRVAGRLIDAIGGLVAGPAAVPLG